MLPWKRVGLEVEGSTEVPSTLLFQAGFANRLSLLIFLPGLDFEAHGADIKAKSRLRDIFLRLYSIVGEIHALSERTSIDHQTPQGSTLHLPVSILRLGDSILPHF